jgi:DNA-damage-inducible protein D
MNSELMKSLHANFEDAAHTKETLTYWLARDLQILLEYTRWETFETAIERAMTACANSNQPTENHFREVPKMVELGAGSSRKIKDYMLTRYACYLIAQNGDPRKHTISFAQSYFAIQTRKQEILAERMQLAERIQARSKLTETEKHLSNTLYEHGVDDKGFGVIRSRGDNSLFGNNNTAEMKRRLNVPADRPLADFLPTVTLKAKELAAAITDFNVRKDNIFGTPAIGDEHVKNNVDVRTVLAKSNILPEDLPPEEDIKKLDRRVMSQEKKMLNVEGSLSRIKDKIDD